MIDVIAVGSLIMLELRRNESGELCWASVIPNSEEKLNLLKQFIAMRTTCSLETILEKLPGVIYIGAAYAGMLYDDSHLANGGENLL